MTFSEEICSTKLWSTRAKIWTQINQSPTLQVQFTRTRPTKLRIILRKVLLRISEWVNWGITGQECKIIFKKETFMERFLSQLHPEELHKCLTKLIRKSVIDTHPWRTKTVTSRKFIYFIWIWLMQIMYNVNFFHFYLIFYVCVDKITIFY